MLWGGSAVKRWH